ncbi:Hypothetical predicted protein [Pelobates cultripes]|uniref:Uncharacterized protein n=1 Tax=Pelobates cultripes TaxID=61616 RepID=A0AAD1RQK7_PELCU|nr:Hypothetical predicted protein [Pelobates cultripes]
MGTDYTTLKRETLKELLEARGKIASNKSKAVLIAELMDRDRAHNSTPAREETPYQREMRTRMEFLPQPVYLEILTVLMADVQERHRPGQNPSLPPSTVR